MRMNGKDSRKKAQKRKKERVQEALFTGKTPALFWCFRVRPVVRVVGAGLPRDDWGPVFNHLSPLILTYPNQCQSVLISGELLQFFLRLQLTALHFHSVSDCVSAALSLRRRLADCGNPFSNHRKNGTGKTQNVPTEHTEDTEAGGNAEFELARESRQCTRMYAMREVTIGVIALSETFA
jgi:hypothetical protein